MSNVPVEEIDKKIRELIADYSDNNMDTTRMLAAVKPLTTLLSEYQDANTWLLHAWLETQAAYETTMDEHLIRHCVQR